MEEDNDNNEEDDDKDDEDDKEEEFFCKNALNDQIYQHAKFGEASSMGTSYIYI